MLGLAVDSPHLAALKLLTYVVVFSRGKSGFERCPGSASGHSPSCDGGISAAACVQLLKRFVT